MKRLIVLVIISLLMCGINLGCVKNLNLETIFPNSDVEVYLPENVEIDGLNTIKNGAGVIVTAKINDLNYILNKYSVVGFTLKINNIEPNDVFKKLGATNCELNANGVYGYVRGMFEPINILGHKVNFQCVKHGESVLIGVPIMLGSY